MGNASNTVALREFLLRGQHYKRPKKQVLQTTEGAKSFNLIKSGFIKRYMILNNGTINIQVIYGPGDFFSVAQLYEDLFGEGINDGPEVYYYETMTDVELYSMPIVEVIGETKINPILYRDILLVTGRRLQSTLQGLESIGLRTSYNRVAHQLHYLAVNFGATGLGGTVIKIPITHQDLADILSITRETVSTSIGELRKKGLIVTGRRVHIPNLRKLEKEAFA